MVIKAQVLAGGRGKGSFDNGLKGGVRVIYSPTEARMFADQMIGHKLITKQTGAGGRLCNSVYICERKFARREFYLAVLMDRASQGPVIVSSSQGGMDIEGVAKENPEAIHTNYIDINVGVTDDIAREIAIKLGFSEQCVEEATDIIKKLYKIFLEKDATQIEINPLSETSDHKVMCMDAKFGFDDNADFRQKEVFSWRDTTQEDADEVRAAQSGLNFIKLDGDIGCLVNGAGLAMATMDIIKLNGGQPANFLDVGGGATPAAIREAFELITSDPKVTAIFVNIFGGIVRCDAIAHGLINTVKALDLKIPIIARLQGTNMEQAHALINDSGMKIFSIDDLQSAAERSVQLSKVVKMGKCAFHSLHGIKADSQKLGRSMLALSSLWVSEECLDETLYPCTMHHLTYGRSCFSAIIIANAQQWIDMRRYSWILHQTWLYFFTREVLSCFFTRIP